MTVLSLMLNLIKENYSILLVWDQDSGWGLCLSLPRTWSWFKHMEAYAWEVFWGQKKNASWPWCPRPHNEKADRSCAVSSVSVRAQEVVVMSFCVHKLLCLVLDILCKAELWLSALDSWSSLDVSSWVIIFNFELTLWKGIFVPFMESPLFFLVRLCAGQWRVISGRWLWGFSIQRDHCCHLNVFNSVKV